MDTSEPNIVHGSLHARVLSFYEKQHTTLSPFPAERAYTMDVAVVWHLTIGYLHREWQRLHWKDADARRVPCSSARAFERCKFPHYNCSAPVRQLSHRHEHWLGPVILANLSYRRVLHDAGYMRACCCCKCLLP